MNVTIYHNPSCSNSRKALEIIRSKGIEPHIVEYLKTPLTPQKLRHLIKDQMKVRVTDVIRSKEPVYDEMELEGRDDDCLLAAMSAHPILMNRPIVVTPKGAMLCRPGETVEGLL
ncbi:MAG TPA: arsenate reductase (glutaredoxin) [Rhizomicrobium sp.]|jgi:arsenate reductase|nr:arsenate reductase (glutaredoxin) [Rhizomicrobium sp.]